MLSRLLPIPLIVPLLRIPAALSLTHRSGTIPDQGNSPRHEQSAGWRKTRSNWSSKLGTRTETRGAEKGISISRPIMSSGTGPWADLQPPCPPRCPRKDPDRQKPGEPSRGKTPLTSTALSPLHNCHKMTGTTA
eukprot:8243696-Pyramimonas_sp.AAC.1